MKSITAWGIAVLAATIASYVNADGVCYDPNHGTGISTENVRADMQTIKNKGFSHVRTYISAFGGTDMASTVAESGLRVALGVPYGADGNLDIQVKSAVNAANKYGNIDYIFVGNENLGSTQAVPQDMIDLIYKIKSQVPGHVKVGTVQKTSAYLNGISGALSAACSVFGVNIHPFFTAGIRVDNGDAIANARSQWNQVKDKVGDRLILTETGWPTDGNFGGSQGSTASAQQYWNDYKSGAGFSFLADDKKFYFQFFDTPYKPQQYERTFGLFNKINAGGTPATPPPTTPAPTTTAPTTTAPATTVPAANATASATGSAASEAGSPVAAGSSSHASESEVGADNDSNTDLGIAKNEDTTIDGTPAPGTSTDAGATETGDNTSDKTTEANTQSAQGKSSIAGIVVVVLFGCAAIGAAFGFIWKARQKAKEIEESESKDFEHSITNTPGGACVL